MTATELLMIKMIQSRYFVVTVNNKATGAAFCQVRKTKQIHLLKTITSGAPQKWRGDKQAFNNKPIVTHLL